MKFYLNCWNFIKTVTEFNVKVTNFNFTVTNFVVKFTEFDVMHYSVIKHTELTQKLLNFI